ncbi:PLD nuclease N-terminal domain-containing protein [Polymorphospora rubra]|uniref:PLD nuclease N-terminal domain-containing protein n=1 Tax=Polymorphospora rubra TaxID=338584 RepID=UPI00340D93F3
MSEGIGFWEAFWLLIIFIPLLLVWGFAIVDIFRRSDMSGLAKAFWMVAVVLMPFVGTLLYLLFRPARETAAAAGPAPAEPVRHPDDGPQYAPQNRAEQLRLLADLHDRGKLSDPEFSAEKARLAAVPVAGAEPNGGLLTRPTITTTRMAAPELSMDGMPAGTPANGSAPAEPPMADSAKA